jgi:hypothetical protein
MKFNEVFDTVYVVDVNDIRFHKDLPLAFQNRFSNYHASMHSGLFFQSNDGSGLHPSFQGFGFNGAVFFYSEKSLPSVHNAIYPFWPHLNFGLRLEPIDSELFNDVILASHEALSKKNRSIQSKRPSQKATHQAKVEKLSEVEFDFKSAPTDTEIDFNAPDDVVTPSASSVGNKGKKRRNNRNKKKKTPAPTPNMVSVHKHVDVEDPPAHSSVKEKLVSETKKETPEPSSPPLDKRTLPRKTHPEDRAPLSKPSLETPLLENSEAEKKKKMDEAALAASVSGFM